MNLKQFMPMWTEWNAQRQSFLYLHWKLALIRNSVVRTWTESVNWKLPTRTMPGCKDKWERAGWLCSVHKERPVSRKNCFWSPVLARCGKKAAALTANDEHLIDFACCCWTALRAMIHDLKFKCYTATEWICTSTLPFRYVLMLLPKSPPQITKITIRE